MKDYEKIIGDGCWEDAIKWLQKEHRIFSDITTYPEDLQKQLNDQLVSEIAKEFKKTVVEWLQQQIEEKF